MVVLVHLVSSDGAASLELEEKTRDGETSNKTEYVSVLINERGGVSISREGSCKCMLNSKRFTKLRLYSELEGSVALEYIVRETFKVSLRGFTNPASPWLSPPQSWTRKTASPGRLLSPGGSLCPC